MQNQYIDVVNRLHKLELLRRIWLQRNIGDIELHKGQLPILEYIERNDGCSQRELADRLCVTPASIALSTKRMCNAGLITKTPDAHNLRCNHLSVTEKGRSLGARMRELFDKMDGYAFSALSGGEKDTLCALLDKVCASLGEGLSDADVELAEGCCMCRKEEGKV